MLEIIKEEAKDGKFLQGSLKKVTEEDIIKDSLFTKARILCLEHTTTQNVTILVKILTEFNEFDLACDLALAFKSSLAYPVAYWLKNYATEIFNDDLNINDEQPLSLYRHEILTVNRTLEYRDVSIANKSAHTHPMIDNLLNNYLPKLGNRDIIELVQRLVAQ